MLRQRSSGRGVGEHVEDAECQNRHARSTGASAIGNSHLACCPKNRRSALLRVIRRRPCGQESSSVASIGCHRPALQREVAACTDALAMSVTQRMSASAQGLRHLVCCQASFADPRSTNSGVPIARPRRAGRGRDPRPACAPGMDEIRQPVDKARVRDECQPVTRRNGVFAGSAVMALAASSEHGLHRFSMEETWMTDAAPGKTRTPSRAGAQRGVAAATCCEARTMASRARSVSGCVSPTAPANCMAAVA